MNISATIRNSYQENVITVSTNHDQKKLAIPSKTEGYGSLVNGGELLFLSLATCFCNDLYREASKRTMKISSVEVSVSGNFGKEGEPASNIRYEVKVLSPEHSEEEINALIDYVDNIAEVHNTLRKGINVNLKR